MSLEVPTKATWRKDTKSSTYYILTCCILHNICVLRGDEFEDDHSSDDEDDEGGDDDGHQIAFGQGRIVRQALTAFLFEWTHFI